MAMLATVGASTDNNAFAREARIGLPPRADVDVLAVR
jgi:hypothetical protein